MGTEREIVVDVVIDPDGNIQKFQQDMRNAARDSGLETEVNKVNSALNRQTESVIKLRREEEKLKTVQQNRKNVAGSDLEKQVTQELNTQRRVVDRLRDSYRNFANRASQALGRARAGITGATQSLSNLNISSTITNGLVSGLRVGFGALATVAQEAGLAFIRFTSDGLRAAVELEEVGEGLRTTREITDSWRESIQRLSDELGQDLLPIFRNIVLFADRAGDSFFNFLGIATGVSGEISRNRTEFNELINTLQNVTNRIQTVALSEEDLSIEQVKREALIRRINTEYPGYLQNLLTEESSLRDLAAAQTIANDVFESQIRIRANNEQTQRLREELAAIEEVIVSNQIVIDQIREEEREEGGLSALREARLGAALAGNQQLTEEYRELQGEITELTSRLETLRQQEAQTNQGLLSTIPNSIGTQIEQLELAIDRIQARQVELSVSPDGIAEVNRLNTAIDTIRARINELRGISNEDNSTARQTATRESREIVENTLAFLRQQRSEINEELEYVIRLDDNEARLSLLNQLSLIDANIRRIEQLNTISIAPQFGAIADNLRQQISELQNVEIPELIRAGQFDELLIAQNNLDSLTTRLDELRTASVDPIEIVVNTPDAQAVIDATRQAVESSQEEQDRINEARTEIRLINLEQYEQDLQTASTLTSSATGAIDDLFSAISQNRIDRENLTDAEVARIRRREFNRQKAFAIVEAGISTALAVTRTLPNLVLAAIVGGIGAIQIAAIAARQAPAGFKEGVIGLDPTDRRIGLRGPGHRTSDSIPARLSWGESVIDAVKTSKNRSALHYIDEGGVLRQQKAIDGSTYFAPRPIAETIGTQVISNNVRSSTIDYRELGNQVAKAISANELNINAKSIGMANQDMMFKVINWLQDHGKI